MAYRKRKDMEATIRVFRRRATYLEATALGRLPTLREFIRALKDNSAFLRRCRGSWYWLGDAVPGTMGYHRIDYDRGAVTQVSDSDYYNLPFEERAVVAGREGHPAVFVFGDYDDGRLAVDAFGDPRFSARLALVQPARTQAPREGFAAPAPRRHPLPRPGIPRDHPA
jgi:hypothetical protein